MSHPGAAGIGTPPRHDVDFSVSADPLDPGRVNVLERWERPEALAAFRSSDEEPGAEPVDLDRVKRFVIEQYTVHSVTGSGNAGRRLTWEKS